MPWKKLVITCALLGVGGAVGGCSSGAPHPAPTTTATTAGPATATTAAPRSTTTSRPIPSAPQSSAEAAASVFMQGWMASNRAQSASVATPSAVAGLFAVPYAQQPLNDRGCTDAFPPFRCTWGPFAGGSGSIYQITLAQAPGDRWYVTGVRIES